jgi:quinoprotein glucose dehydrogenase
VAAAALPLVYAQKGVTQKTVPKAAGEWPMYNRDLGATRYSPLTQINTRNVSRLTKAWSYKLGKDRTSGSITGGSEFTPIVVKGVMYLATSTNRVIALEPESGKEIWTYEVKNGVLSRRNLAFWPGDSNNPPRIIFSTGQHLIALNATTGKIDPGFGKEGEVDMVVPYESAPVVYKNILLVGANVGEATVGPPGDTRAYDARTGAKLWDFHSVAQPGDPGHETWEGDSWKGRSGTNVWGFSMTVDEARGILYMPLGGPSANYYGGDRKGNNLYANSVVAVDATTGKLRWYFQTVHHDLFDYDLPPTPALLDVTVKGKRVPVIAQTGKSGWMFILDRVTGKPVFGVEERPVAKSDVPGEQSSPTQPFPLKPPPLARVSYKPEDIVTAADTNEEHAKFCRDLVARSGGLYNEGPFSPYLYRDTGAPPRSTILFPGSIGGVDWGGMAADPRLGYFFVNSQDEASIGWIEKKPDGRYDRNSIVGPTSRFQWFEGDPRRGNIVNAGEHAWPCQKPPWGRLTAVNAATGDIAWQVPLGVTDDLPEGKRNTGRLNMGGPIATAGGLVFIAATNDRRFRAFDSKTGKELWATKLDISAHAVPMTYQGKDGKQYVAIVDSGESALDDPAPAGSQALVVFALP